ncbi:MAG TPA: SRPBCC family protein [Candidatus Limnocylindrales bacterium]|nr:SRPBCC family protein [Candidatus Limnocylindrales bacterium]
MGSIEKSIVVDRPVSTVYNQWTQFEEFPRFMEGVESVRQLDDKRLHWRANIAGNTEEWDAEIVEQKPDQVIAWRSTSGSLNAGRVTFQPEGAGKTRVTLRMDYEPEGAVEATGDALGFVTRRVEGDLDRFEKFIEERGSETGAWRGEISAGRVEEKEEERLGR